MANAQADRRDMWRNIPKVKDRLVGHRGGILATGRGRDDPHSQSLSTVSAGTKVQTDKTTGMV